MSITQVITDLTDPPDTNDTANFDVRADQLFNVELPQLITELNVYRTEANSTAVDVNADAATAADAALTAIAARDVAVGAANYRGDYLPGTTYQIGQSVSYLGKLYAAKTINLGITPVDGVNWLEVTSLPDQTGNAGKFLTTDGNDPSWADVSTFANNTRLAQVQAVALSF